MTRFLYIEFVLIDILLLLLLLLYKFFLETNTLQDSYFSLQKKILFK